MRIVTFERPEARDALARGQGALGAAALGLQDLEGVRHGARRIGALMPDGPLAGATIDLNRALAVQLALEDAGAPEAQADSLLPADTARFMRRWDSASEAARATLHFVSRAADSYDAPDWKAAGVVVPADAGLSHAPVARSASLLHAEGEEPPFLALPLLASSLAYQSETLLPAGLEVHARGALCLVVCRTAHRVDPSQAHRFIAGFCVGLEFVGTRFLGQPIDPGLGHSCDGFTALGPWLATTDELASPSDLLARTRCSGELVEASRSKHDLDSLGALLARISELVTLSAGDLILLPLPGHRSRNLRDGDVLEVDIEGLGRVVRHVRGRV